MFNYRVGLGQDFKYLGKGKKYLFIILMYTCVIRTQMVHYKPCLKFVSEPVELKWAKNFVYQIGVPTSAGGGGAVEEGTIFQLLAFFFMAFLIYFFLLMYRKFSKHFVETHVASPVYQWNYYSMYLEVLPIFEKIFTVYWNVSMKLNFTGWNNILFSGNCTLCTNYLSSSTNMIW